MKLHLRTVGSPENPVLVCLHGFMGDGRDFFPPAQILSSRFFILLPDLPGHGQSGRFHPGKKWSIPFCAAAVADLIRPYAPLNLLGYSLGGRVALALAQQEPGLLQRLIIESALPGIEDGKARRKRAEHDDTLAQRLLRESPEKFLESWYRQPLFAGIEAHPQFADMQARRLENNPKLMARALSQMSSGRMPNLWPGLSQMHMPVLLINGAQDARYRSVNARMKTINPAFILREASGAGHNVHFSRPDWFGETVCSFLTGAS